MNWTKRVPVEMVAEYVSMGWQVQTNEGKTVVLVWNREGAPK